MPEDLKLNDVLLLNVFAPYEHNTLLDDSEKYYGEPAQIGNESKGKDYVNYKEYKGKYGRIKIYEENYESEEGWETANWLEVYPGAVYLEELVNRKYLEKIRRMEGKWKLSLSPKNKSWHLTIYLENHAITQLNYLPKK